MVRPSSDLRIERIWALRGRVGEAVIGERYVYVTLSTGGILAHHQQLLYAMDRTTRESFARAIGRDVEVVHVDPLVVETWDGQLQRWRGTHLARLSETLDPIWTSERMNMWVERARSGPLVVAEITHTSEYVGMDADSGRVVLRVRGEGDGVFGGSEQAPSFVATPTETMVVLSDNATGETRGTIAADFGSWTVVGDRVVVSRGDRLVGYDPDGNEVWSREGSFPRWLRHGGASGAGPGDALGRAPLVLTWDGDRGVSAVDEHGEERWLFPVSGEHEWSEIGLFRSTVSIRVGERSFMLDVRSGEVALECSDGCSVVDFDEDAILTQSPGEGSARFTLHGRSGGARWTHEAEAPVREGGEPRSPSSALLPRVVALCSAGGPVIFLDRADGRRLSEALLPSYPEERRGGSPHCTLRSRDGHLLAISEQGVALFETPFEGEPPPLIAEPAPAGPSARRPMYVLPTLVPRAHSPLPAEYGRGRAAYREARDAFEAERFGEAATLFLNAYRTFRAASDLEVRTLGLHCCQNVRVSLENAGEPQARSALVAQLGAQDAECARILRSTGSDQ